MATSIQSPEETMQENIRTLGQKIRDINVAMLTTVDPDGLLRSRPMVTQEAEFDGQLWFFTSAASGKVSSIKNDQNINLSYASPEDNRYVSVSGRARLVRDREKMEDLWSPMLKAWFPKGIDDPEISLLCVEVESAEYWDSPSNAFVQLVGFTKAIFTGKRYDDSKHHGRMNLRSPDQIM